MDDLISREAVRQYMESMPRGILFTEWELNQIPSVDAVVVPDRPMQRAIKMLLEQYEHSKASKYVLSPLAHAFFHTWRKLDDRTQY